MENQGPLLINDRYLALPGPRVGGMAVVYKAIDTQDGASTVALKMFGMDLVDDRLMREAYRRETDALRELQHPNIVRLLRAGEDDATGRPFLVLEWLEHDLEYLIADQGSVDGALAGWDSFYDQLGRPLLDALAHAHSRSIIHRDLKPSNVLLDASGEARLADFSISKIKRYLTPGVTLREFASRPYTAPEVDDGSASYSRDVFGFGVLVLRCLTGQPMRDYQDLEPAIEVLDAPAAVVQAVARAVSLQPEERPADAHELQADLARIQRRRQRTWAVRTCYIKLTSRAIEQVGSDVGSGSEAEIRKQVLDDLNEVCGIEFRRRREDGAAGTDEEYWLYGQLYRYQAFVDAANGSHLVLDWAKKMAPSYLERRREEAWEPPYCFRLVPVDDTVQARATIDHLYEAVFGHEEQRAADAGTRSAQELFGTWQRVLDATKVLINEAEDRLPYNGVESDGQRAKFTLVEPTEAAGLTDQARIVRVGRAISVAGCVEEVSNGVLTLFIEQVGSAGVPSRGELVVDQRAAMVPLDRQGRALDLVRTDAATRADLGLLLTEPAQARPVAECAVASFANTELDEAKQAAVRAALGATDILLVQGPPGTGKTTFIAELIVQELRVRPGARILLTGQTHASVDNAVERVLRTGPDFQLVRVARPDDRRVADAVEPYTVPNQMQLWGQRAIDQGGAFVSQWAVDHGISLEDVRVAIALGRLAAIDRRLAEYSARRELAVQARQESVVREAARTGQPEDEVETAESQSLLDEIQALEALLAEGRVRRRDAIDAVGSLGFSVSDVDRCGADGLESLASYLTGDRLEAKQLKEMVEIHEEWALRFGKGSDFNAPLLASSSLVAGTCIGLLGLKQTDEVEYDLCILDEASKATATEALVPAVRARRWVLVGDDKQLPPYQEDLLERRDLLEDHRLREHEVEDTLFSRLLRGLPPSCIRRLDTQHRMVGAIGGLVNECFYDGWLKSDGPPDDLDLAPLFAPPVLWLNTSKLPNHQETRQPGGGFTNESEVVAICDLCQRIQQLAEHSCRELSVVILSGYVKQQERISHALRGRLAYWRNLAVRCSSVDAFQGRETDIAVYSVARSNDGRDVGFLSRPERINVALSRGRYGLALVGDLDFCCRLPLGQPLRAVADYVRGHADHCHVVRCGDPRSQPR